MKKYAKELKKCLNKFDVKALDEFVETHQEYYSLDFLVRWNKETPTVKKLTLCKIIIRNTAVDRSTYKMARQWLLRYYMEELEVLYEN